MWLCLFSEPLIFSETFQRDKMNWLSSQYAIIQLKSVIKSAVWLEQLCWTCLLCLMPKHVVGLAASSCFSSLLTVLPDPFCLLLSVFLRGRYIPQPPRSPNSAGPVPAAAHRRTARLVLPQVIKKKKIPTTSPHRCLAMSQSQSTGWPTLPPLVTEAEPAQEVLLVDSPLMLVWQKGTGAVSRQKGVKTKVCITFGVKGYRSKILANEKE